MIVCLKCNEGKHTNAFGKRSDNGNRKGVCVACENTYQQDYYQRKKEKKKLAARKHYFNNKEKRKAYLATRKDKDKLWNRDYKLRTNYGITLAVVYDTIEMQRSCCPICGTYYRASDRRWHVDHCHETGKVRGIICSNCNTMLGQAKDNIETLRRAIDYLKGNK